MLISKRSKFYLGLVLITGAVIFLAILVLQGPYDKFSKNQLEIIYDSPNGPVFTDIKSGDRLILSFESTEPVNVILLRPENYGKFFILEERSGFEFHILAAQSTGDSIEHTFNSSGTWKLYFENPTPPPNSEPEVRYSGEFIKQEDDLVFYYLNISVAIVLIILALALLISSKAFNRKSRK